MLPGVWGAAWHSPCTHLQRVPRDDKGAVVLPAEGIQLQVGLAAVGHLGGSGEVRRPCPPEVPQQQITASWSRCEDNSHPSQGGPPSSALHQTQNQPESCLLQVGGNCESPMTPAVTLHFPQGSCDTYSKNTSKHGHTFMQCQASCSARHTSPRVFLMRTLRRAQEQLSCVCTGAKVGQDVSAPPPEEYSRGARGSSRQAWPAALQRARCQPG